MEFDEDVAEQVAENAARAGEALTALANGPAQQAANAMSDAFDRVGANIERSLLQAARTGETSFSSMVDAILRDLSRIAVEHFISGPFENMANGFAKSLPFFGARAEGGPVQPGGAYLVGERGPEVFVPNTAGQISAGQTLNVHITLNGATSAEGIRRSESQIATALARAVRKGAARL